jgi:hypothetical protein
MFAELPEYGLVFSERIEYGLLFKELTEYGTRGLFKKCPT